MDRNEPENGWCVYILKCADGSLYAGITNRLERRVERHLAGTASRYTRSRLPVSLAWSESAGSRSEALKREAAIKRLTRGEKVALCRRRVRSGVRGSRPRRKSGTPTGSP